VTALEISAAVRVGTTRAAAVIETALDRIAELDPQLTAFTAVFAERARAHAARVDADIAAGRDPGPLAGVPFAAKDLFDVAGVVTRAGASVTADDPPAAHDADSVAALERQGAVLVGVTNMDEFAYGFVTENAHTGATRNPHDLDRIAGGSSGGSAAAVCAGLVPLALGSDTNGSIRVPAALCGICGIRPTLGRLSRRGAYPFANSLDTVGPFARTIADLQAAFAALDPLFEATPTVPPGLRCARLTDYFDTGLLPQARLAVERVCAALATTQTIALPDAARAREAAYIITAAEAGELHAARLRGQAAEYDPATRDRLTGGALMPAAWYIRAQRFRSWFHAQVVEIFARCDVLIAPATPYPATRIGQTSIDIDGSRTAIRPNLGVFTQPITLTGMPVVTIPIGEAGTLPVGVQLIGRAGSENVLLALAAELEGRGIAVAPAPPLYAGNDPRRVTV
jgi:AtzE family amidohydrolase